MAQNIFPAIEEALKVAKATSPDITLRQFSRTYKFPVSSVVAYMEAQRKSKISG